MTPSARTGRLRYAANQTKRRYDRCDDDELLRRLRVLLEKEGRLTTDLVIASPATPCVTTYQQRFGSIRRAFARIGYDERMVWSDKIGGYWTKENILAGVKRLQAEHGYVSGKMIAKDPLMPWTSTVLARFRTLLNCYSEAGFPATFAEINLATSARAARRREASRDAYEQKLLDGLRALLREKGELSRRLIDEAPDLPNPNTIALRFGGMRRVYALVGYVPTMKQEENFARVGGQSISAAEAAEIAGRSQGR